MRLIVALLVVGSLSLKPALFAQFDPAPQEWELNIETGADFRQTYEYEENTTLLEEPADGAQQGGYAPSVAASVLLRITGLRAYYGLRVEGHYADWSVGDVKGNAYTAGALATYKAFLFDMEGDCDCPRWDKSNFFKKAFFVEFGLGYAQQGFKRDVAEASYETRGGVSYLARVGIAVRLKKQMDVYLAGGAHGLFAKEFAIGSHDLGVRPTLGFTWRPFYNRF